MGPGEFVPLVAELASGDDAFNAAITAAFAGADEAPRLLGWAAEHRGEVLARAAFGLLAADRRWRAGEVDAFDGRIDDARLLRDLAERIGARWVFSATELNAYAQCPWRFFARYLLRLERALAGLGYRQPIHLMTSGGSLASLDTAVRMPVRLVESGPAGGAILAGRIALERGESRVLSFDMGGTTAKICLIDDGAPLKGRVFEIDRQSRFKKGSGLPVRTGDDRPAEHRRSVPSVRDQFGLPQHPEVPRHRGLGQSHDLDDLRHAKFMQTEYLQERSTRGVRHGLKYEVANHLPSPHYIRQSG